MLALDTVLVPTSIEDLARTARAAEHLGFSGLVTAETAHDPYLPLMIAAEHTRAPQLLTSIAVAFPRSPMVTAYIAWDLQRYSNGRFLLGLGTQVKGHNERRFSVVWDRPVARMRDLIKALRAIWECWQEGTPLAYHGEFYRFDLMTPFFNPGPIEHPNVPVYVAGVNAGICRLAGELCDGFHIHPLHTRAYIEQVVKPLIAEGASRTSRSPHDVKLAASCFVVTGRSREEMANAADMVKQQIAFYASTRTYARVLETHGWQELSPILNEMSRSGRWGEMGKMIPDDMLREVSVIAPRDEVAAKLREKYDGLIDRIMLYVPFYPGSDEDWWRDLAETLSA